MKFSPELKDQVRMGNMKLKGEAGGGNQMQTRLSTFSCLFYGECLFIGLMLQNSLVHIFFSFSDAMTLGISPFKPILRFNLFYIAVHYPCKEDSLAIIRVLF